MSLIESVIEDAFNPKPECTCRCHHGVAMFEYLECCPKIGHPLDDDNDVWPMLSVYNTVWYGKHP